MDPNLDILDWWSRHEFIFPTLALVARFILSIPASSAKGESNFSTAGLIVSDLRTSLNPEKVNENLVMKSNYDLLEKNRVTLIEDPCAGDKEDWEDSWILDVSRKI